jgi:transcriptional regulator with XRE-family HTH domain
MLATRLGLLRNMAQVGNRELDRLAGITAGHSWLIENGKRENPELKTLEAIASATGASVGWLAAGEGRPPTVEQVHVAINAARARLEAAGKATGTDGAR